MAWDCVNFRDQRDHRLSLLRHKSKIGALKLLVGWWPVHQAPFLSTERKVPGAALRDKLETNRPERETRRGGSDEVATQL